MRRTTVQSLLLAALASFMLLSVASATTLVKLNLETLTDRSEHIIQGKVMGMESLEERGRIVTHVRVQVAETLKGDLAPAQTITVRVLGGRLGDLVTIVHGSPNFSQDEEVLLFMQRLKTRGPGLAPLVVTGMAQGKFTLTTGPDQKTLYVVPGLGEVPLVEPMDVRDEEGNLHRRLRDATPSSLHQSVLALDIIRARIQQRINTPPADAAVKP